MLVRFSFILFSLFVFCDFASCEEPTIEEILKVWKEREEAIIGAEVKWSETLVVPKGAADKTFIQGKPIPAPTPAEELSRTSEGVFRLFQRKVFCDSQTLTLLASGDKFAYQPERIRERSFPNELKQLRYAEPFATAEPKDGKLLAITSLQCADGFLQTLLVLWRGHSTLELWDWKANAPALKPKKAQINNSKPLLHITWKESSFKWINVYTETQAPYRPLFISASTRNPDDRFWLTELNYTDEKSLTLKGLKITQWSEPERISYTRNITFNEWKAPAEEFNEADFALPIPPPPTPKEEPKKEPENPVEENPQPKPKPQPAEEEDEGESWEFFAILGVCTLVGCILSGFLGAYLGKRKAERVLAARRASSNPPT